MIACWRSWFLLCLLLIQAGPGSAQKAHSIAAFQRINTSNGLPSNNITALAQDSRGFYWIGTLEGLSRWDGVHVLVTQQQHRDLRSPSVCCLQAHTDSLMLIGTYSGLCVYNIKRARYENFRIGDTMIRAGMPSKVETITRMPGGNILIAASGTFILLDPQLRRLASRKLNLATGSAAYVPWPGSFPDRDSTLLLYTITRKQLYAMDTRTLQDVALPPRLSGLSTVPSSYMNVALQLPGRFLFSSWGEGGLADYRIVQGQHKMLPLNTIDWGDGNTVKCIAVDPFDTDVVWMGTGNGLYTYDLSSGKIEKYLIVDPMIGTSNAQNWVSALHFDQSGGLLAGTAAGVYRVSPQRRNFEVVQLSGAGIPLGGTGLPVQDRFGRLWIPQWGKNLIVLDSNGRVTRRFDEKLDGTGVFNWKVCIVRDTVYLTSNFGLHYFNPRTKRFEKPWFIPDSLKRRECFGALHYDSRQCWWLGFASLGLFWYDMPTGASGMIKWVSDSTFQASKATVGITNVAPPSVMAEDRNGDLWIARCWIGGRLARVDHKTKRVEQVMPLIKGLLQDKLYVIGLNVDKNNKLWVTSTDYGLLCYDIPNKQWSQFRLGNNLASASIRNLVHDPMDNLWVATDNGLSVLEPGRAQFKQVGTGLPFKEIESITIPDPSQPWRLLIVGTTSMAWADMRAIYQEPKAPGTYIENVVAEDKLVETYISPVSFDHTTNHFRFSYTAPVYERAGELQYAYRLQGLDKDWKEAGSETSIYVTGIPPGSYTFLVRARLADGAWGAPATFSFYIQAPFWQRWWFYALCLLSAGAITYAVYRYQLSKALALYRVRNRISRDLHDEVGSTLSSISLMNEVAAHAGDSRPLHRKMRESIHQVQTAMSDIVWMINPRNDSFDNLLLRFNEVAAELLEPTGISYHISTSGVKEANITMEVRREVYMIYKEALNNIVKYAAASEVQVLLKVDRARLELSVRDNGRGMNIAQESSGNGLKNMAERARALKGTAVISSAPGSGTAIVIHLPLL